MCRCSSCDTPLESYEMFRTVEVEGGKTIEIIDNFCNSCKGKYVDRVDELDTHDYAFEYDTEYIVTNLRHYSE